MQLTAFVNRTVAIQSAVAKQQQPFLIADITVPAWMMKSKKKRYIIIRYIFRCINYFRGDTGDPEFIKRQEQKRSELDEQLREYIAEWRQVRIKEALELKR